MNENTGANGEPVYRAPAVGTVPIPVYRDLLRERDALRAALSCAVTNLEKGMSRGIQRLQAEALREVLAALKGSH